MNTHSSFNKEIMGTAVRDACRKLDPRTQLRNPIMFIVYIGAIITTWFTVRDFVQVVGQPAFFTLQITLWLWFTVLFANFAEAVAEGRGKAQANALRSTRSQTKAKKVVSGRTTLVDAVELRKGDVVLVEVGEFIPGDGEIIEGMASVDESAVTGESASVIRESGGDKSSVTGGTRVLSDWIKIRITANPGETFLDRMISLVEGAKRKKRPMKLP
ncbi:K+-transporting ATPase subunit B [Acetonema longum DSM 6540]|uniref:K+-transporting ATPase subunit B n=1 Tax=Acetonema longum DSM 6540 TaxID=1009370 RepID=F7NIM9_9FIRM|nr:K+-transporting ATPase subunit B [Acetonema longum]EGO64093.1 K+-transporting ATPase subunit B [Acetonema longum DSM 6540]